MQNYIWLAFGGACLFFALVFWAITDTDELVEVEKKAETEVELQIQPEKVAAMNHLGALFDEVKPLEMTTRVVTAAQHEAEFRGTKFVNEQKNAYAIELFRVTDEAILKNFLKKQPERKGFTYLRLSGEGHPEQYVLLYGIYRNAAGAESALADLKLDLPASVKPAAAEIGKYQPLVNDLGTDELSASSQLHEVKLKTAPLPKIDEAQAAALQAQVKAKAQQKAAEPKAATTTTTVTQRDADGNVVNVQRSQSSAEHPKAPAQQEVADPFN
ncbi:hypothetical protein [Acinetobacter sp.]|uniref:hypothetical protein n=1 Tax=Acinetobacter sp. TaxID=472 RepID=UPI0035ADE120